MGLEYDLSSFVFYSSEKLGEVGILLEINSPNLYELWSIAQYPIQNLLGHPVFFGLKIDKVDERKEVASNAYFSNVQQHDMIAEVL